MTMPNPNDWNLQRGPRPRRVTAREAIAELQHRYLFWRTAFFITWALNAIIAILVAR